MIEKWNVNFLIVSLSYRTMFIYLTSFNLDDKEIKISTIVKIKFLMQCITKLKKLEKELSFLRLEYSKIRIRGFLR